MRRIYHPWHKWECYKAGFYETTAPAGMSADEARLLYASFLRDSPRIEMTLASVVKNWPVSCEQFLSNENINRIAWLGQASMCLSTGVPACFRGGFRLLSAREQLEANGVAEKWLNRWIRMQGDEKQNTEICEPMETPRLCF